VKAKQFVTSGRYSWNSGMFVWKVDRFLQELARTMPKFYDQLLKIEAAIDTPQYESILNDVWSHVETQTVDYGVMEKASDVAVIPAEFGWNDVGSWATLLEILQSDDQGNVAAHANHLAIDTSNTLVYGRDRLVATIGLHDFIVVDAGDALLICPKDRAQDVKKIVDQLKSQGRKDYL
jgi:mannose-1-phosphate guanylyltransferase